MTDFPRNNSIPDAKINNEYLILCILMTVSVLFRAPFIFEGFSEADAASIGVSIIDYINHGQDGNFTNLYFLDVIPGYVLYIKLVMKILNNNYAHLTTVMNYTNVVVGTLIIVPCYFFVKRLSGNRSIAFCTTLSFVFVPSVYRLSILGLPPLLPLLFFITSLYLFLVWLDNSSYIYFIASFISLTATIFFKSDFSLGVGAYFGLLFMREAKDKQRIVLTLCLIVFSIMTFLLLRQWVLGHQYEGPALGSTTSISDFIKWGERFFMPLYIHFNQKHYAFILKSQVKPVIDAMGILNFLIAGCVLIFYGIKKRYDIVTFVLSWTAIPTVLWLLLYPNTQRHNLLSVLPFVIIIYLFLYGVRPKFIVWFSVLIVVGNLFLAAPGPLTDLAGGNFFQQQLKVRNLTNTLHLVANRISNVNDDKIIFAPPSFKAYLLYELFSLKPGYKTIRIDEYCYGINDNKCIVCFKGAPGEDPVDFISNRISSNHLERYTIIATSLNLQPLRDSGLNVIDNSDIQTWISYKDSIPQFNIPSRI